MEAAVDRGRAALAYGMIAERENETVKSERSSLLIAVAKARVWASEGWQVIVTDGDGKAFALPELEQLVSSSLPILNRAVVAESV
jgi:hypothetical protein